MKALHTCILSGNNQAVPEKGDLHQEEKGKYYHPPVLWEGKPYFSPINLPPLQPHVTTFPPVMFASSMDRFFCMRWTGLMILQK